MASSACIRRDAIIVFGGHRGWVMFESTSIFSPDRKAVLMSFGRLFLRATVGGFFIGHGAQKLFGWFGGHGIEGTGGLFEKLGLRPGKVHATAAGVAEAGGGALLVAGFATPLAAAAITGTMLTAIHRVHGKNGPFVTNNGYEYNAVLIAASLALAETGPGTPSLDHALGTELTGPKWAALALAGGAAGAAGAAWYSANQAEPPAAAAEAERAESAAQTEPATDVVGVA
jgi:putative oxidoreductase